MSMWEKLYWLNTAAIALLGVAWWLTARRLRKIERQTALPPCDICGWLVRDHAVITDHPWTKTERHPAWRRG